MQLIIKDDQIIEKCENTDIIIENYSSDEYMNIFISDNTIIENEIVKTKELIIPAIKKIIRIEKEKEIPAPYFSYRYMPPPIIVKYFENKEIIISPEKTITIKSKNKQFKLVSELNIQNYVSETYHLSSSNIKLNIIINENRNIDNIKEDLKRYVKLARWEKEISGTQWIDTSVEPNITYEVDTDRESQSKLTASYLVAYAGIRPEPGKWKFKNGFADLTNMQMISLGNTILGFVQTLYDLEENYISQIENSTTIQQLNEIDFNDLQI